MPSERLLAVTMILLHPPCSQWASGWGLLVGPVLVGLWEAEQFRSTKRFILEREEPLMAWEGKPSWVKGLWVLGIEQTQRHRSAKQMLRELEAEARPTLPSSGAI